MYYFKQLINDKIVSVESKTSNVPSPDFVAATEKEFSKFIASLPVTATEVKRDYGAEIDALVARLDKLEISVVR